MNTIQEKMQAEAAELSRHAAGLAAAQQEQAQALRVELAQQQHADLLARYTERYTERQELGKELQETAHQLRALDATPPTLGQEDAHDQRAGLLAARERRLTRQAQQLDEALAQLDQELHSRVAQAAAQRARQVKAEHNRLVQELEAKKVALLEQMQTLQREYDGPIGETRRQLVALSMLTPVDLALVGVGTYREQ